MFDLKEIDVILNKIISSRINIKKLLKNNTVINTNLKQKTKLSSEDINEMLNELFSNNKQSGLTLQKYYISIRTELNKLISVNKKFKHIILCKYSNLFQLSKDIFSCNYNYEQISNKLDCFFNCIDDLIAYNNFINTNLNLFFLAIDNFKNKNNSNSYYLNNSTLLIKNNYLNENKDSFRNINRNKCFHFIAKYCFKCIRTLFTLKTNNYKYSISDYFVQALVIDPTINIDVLVEKPFIYKIIALIYMIVDSLKIELGRIKKNVFRVNSLMSNESSNCNENNKQQMIKRKHSKNPTHLLTKKKYFNESNDIFSLNNNKYNNNYSEMLVLDNNIINFGKRHNTIDACLNNDIINKYNNRNDINNNNNNNNNDKTKLK